jgi:hypothetical protein
VLGRVVDPTEGNEGEVRLAHEGLADVLDTVV